MHEHIDFAVTRRSVFALAWAVVVLSIAAGAGFALGFVFRFRLLAK